jgi:signal transduction histidine kinase
VGLVLAAGAASWLARRAVRPMAAALTIQRQFVADASHELRTPLTLLSTRVQLLQRHLRGAGTAENLLGEADKVVTDAHHLTAILEDLLLAADQVADAVVSFDLAELAEQVTEAYRGSAAAGGVTLAVRRPGSPVHVRGAPTAVRRAVTALLDNAIRHATAAVTVTVSTVERTAVLDVVDDGPGIDPEVLPRMFDRFATTRTRPSPTTGRRRYGLGLALVSDIAARHGGDITATAQPGGGSRLRLSLPLDRPR